jgi:UDP-hydrolysing UDP-N-acetyl-D-glucosamine 2-epimerase
MRKILIATVGRSDYSIYRSIMEKIDVSPTLDYSLLVSGAHLSKIGHTVDEIKADQRPIAVEIPLSETSPDQASMAAAMGQAIIGVAEYYSRTRPDILVVLGDRFEMFAIVAATVPFNIPIAHIHGGELSFGAVDDVFRHAITKMSHLHFAATQEYAERIVRMGEEPSRVTVSGAPSLDNVRLTSLPSRADLESRFGIPLARPPLLVTFHPVTRQFGDAEKQIEALLSALSRINAPMVFTAPNADSGGAVIRHHIAEFVAARSDRYLVESFGGLNYLAMLREAAIVIGNSSSGLIETPSFKVPAVNIGDRQKGRTRGMNVIDAPAEAEAIFEGVQKALSNAFRDTLRDTANPYGDGFAAEKIVRVLETTDTNESFIAKEFYDAPLAK